MSRQQKYSLAYKLDAVRQVVAGRSSVRQKADLLQINIDMLRRWVSYYRAFGTAGLERQNNRYPASFKMEVIRTYLQESLSLKATCLRFHIPCTAVLSRWLRIYEQEGNVGLKQEKRGKRKSMAPKKPATKGAKVKTREQELEEELAYLRLENQYLKKLQALIQKKQEEKAKEKKRS
ncbi:helix-turn-helix domain-containing protein [Chitinophaga niabensis]